MTDYCPCQIHRNDCDYHKPTPTIVANGSRVPVNGEIWKSVKFGDCVITDADYLPGTRLVATRPAGLSVEMLLTHQGDGTLFP